MLPPCPAIRALVRPRIHSNAWFTDEHTNKHTHGWPRTSLPGQCPQAPAAHQEVPAAPQQGIRGAFPVDTGLLFAWSSTTILRFVSNNPSPLAQSDVEKLYKFGKVLGTGNFAEVKLATHRETGKAYEPLLHNIVLMLLDEMSLSLTLSSRNKMILGLCFDFQL